MGFPFIGMLLICLFLKQDPTITKAVLKLTMYPGWFPTWDSCVSAFSVMGFQVCATTPGLVGCFLRGNSVVWYALHSVGMFFVSAKGVLCWGTLWATCWASAQEIPLLGIWSCGLVACWGLRGHGPFPLLLWLIELWDPDVKPAYRWVAGLP